MNLSVLQNFKPEHFKMDPFPHIHIPQVLPWSLYKDLEETYPEELMLKGKTRGFDTRRYQQKDFDYSRITALWKAFADYHTSKFFKEQLDEKKENLYSNIDDMLNQSLKSEEE